MKCKQNTHGAGTPASNQLVSC